MWNRRRFLTAAAVLGAGGLGLALRPSDRGANHTRYYVDLGKALDEAGLARPTLVIDRQRLLANADVLHGHLEGRYDYRVVAKSLPSLPLVETVMKRTGTERLMVFHQPFLNLIADALPDTDVLMGKPMPEAAAARFYDQHDGGAFDTSRQLQWLVDSGERLRQYRQLAQQRNLPMRINLEIDVGLHRGGLTSVAELAEVLGVIEADPLLSFSGFMGYEPHVVKIPGIIGGPPKAFEKAQSTYRDFVGAAETVLGRSVRDLTLNAAGSPTYQLYEGDESANELSAGSGLVKPTDFDLDTLADHQPAAFIATPVIKAHATTKVPGLEPFAGAMAWLNPNRAKAFFIYGGYWKAVPESPAGLSVNPIYGHSTNQEMLNGSASITLRQDDWVFLRPTQSEHVFLQLGDIAVYDSGRIVERWPVFTEGA
jgi:D-serine deaminase-like pyridoxal phosphate-dependent protein